MTSHDIPISRLFAAQDKINIGSAVILDEIYQSEEAFFISNPLNGRNVEHIRSPLGVYLPNLRFDSFREHADDFELLTPGIKFKLETASNRHRICPASPTPRTVARSRAFKGSREAICFVGRGGVTEWADIADKSAVELSEVCDDEA